METMKHKKPFLLDPLCMKSKIQPSEEYSSLYISGHRNDKVAGWATLWLVAGVGLSSSAWERQREPAYWCLTGPGSLESLHTGP